jgi:hypothetical protein
MELEGERGARPKIEAAFVDEPAHARREVVGREARRYS